jgi:Cu/Ag efflux protein CusF
MPRLQSIQHIVSAVSCALLLVCSAAHAEVIELEGTVKAVDVDARTISIERRTAKGTKTLELEVTKKAGDLSAVKAGDEISFSYDPDLEIVTRIGREEELTTNVIRLKELRKAYNTAPWVSEDGLRLYWQSADPDGTRWIWTASRSQTNGLWESQRKVVPGSDVTLTADELNLFVFEAGTICFAKRHSRDAAFPRPEPLSELRELKQGGMLVRPCVSADGLFLWFDKGGEGGVSTYRVSRPTVASPWSKPTVVDRTVVGVGNGFYINSVEGYGLFAMQTPLVEGSRFAIARTSDKGLSFGNAKPLVIPENLDGKMPFYCKATSELFFAGHPTEDKTSQLFVVRNFVLPAP